MSNGLPRLENLEFRPFSEGERTLKDSGDTLDALKKLFRPYSRYTDATPRGGDFIMGGHWSNNDRNVWEFRDQVLVSYSVSSNGYGVEGELSRESLSMSWFEEGADQDQIAKIQGLIEKIGFSPALDTDK
jgi:hypothetical protein